MNISQQSQPVPARIKVFKNSEANDLYDDFYHVNWQTSTTVDMLNHILAYPKISTLLSQPHFYHTSMF